MRQDAPVCLKHLLAAKYRPNAAQRYAKLCRIIPHGCGIIPQRPTRRAARKSLRRGPAGHIPAAAELRPHLRRQKKGPAGGPFRLHFGRKRLPQQPFSRLTDGFEPDCRHRLHGGSLTSPEGSPPSRCSRSSGSRSPMGWAKIKRAPPV